MLGPSACEAEGIPMPRPRKLVPLVAVNPRTRRYHLPTCHEFSPDHEQLTERTARMRGYEPCRMCAA